MKIGFTSVVGDLLHAGHLKMLEECKSQCDYLIVGLITDPSDRGKHPVESVFERFTRLNDCKYVDEVVPLQNEKDLELYLASCVGVSMRFVGEDYLGRDFTGKHICEDRGIDIKYNNRSHGLSSTSLKERVKGV